MRTFKIQTRALDNIATWTDIAATRTAKEARRLRRNIIARDKMASTDIRVVEVL